MQIIQQIPILVPFGVYAQQNATNRESNIYVKVHNSQNYRTQNQSA